MVILEQCFSEACLISLKQFILRIITYESVHAKDDNSENASKTRQSFVLLNITFVKTLCRLCKTDSFMKQTNYSCE